MNFFFGIKNSLLSCDLTIPTFKNFGNSLEKNYIFEAFPKNDKWEINEIQCEKNEQFFFLKNDNIDNSKIFFLANKDQIKKFINEKQEISDISNFTNTTPAYRANLKIFIPEKGFSSYQSEYPYSMTTKTGNILSPINLLLNKNADKNIIFFKNIFYKPQVNKSKLYFINFKKKKIIREVEIKKNYLNEIEVANEHISKDIYIFTEELLGIPLYLSIKNNHLSFEHTHPPHHYILSEDRFKIVSKIKNEFKNIIF